MTSQKWTSQSSMVLVLIRSSSVQETITISNDHNLSVLICMHAAIGLRLQMLSVFSVCLSWHAPEHTGGSVGAVLDTTPTSIPVSRQGR